MPLSEHEQRILRQIEQRFYEQDPLLVERVRGGVTYAEAKKHAIRYALGFLVGVAVLGGTFVLSAFGAVAGIVIMVVAALGLEKNVSVMLRAAPTDQADDGFSPPSSKGSKGGSWRWLARRFRRSD